MTKRKPKRGYFKPKNPQKYTGDSSNIVYRSGWELLVMKYLDENTNVVKWSSDGLGMDNMPTEESGLAVPYISPVDKRVHRYFPDFVAQVRTINGEIKTFVLEVKPKAQTVEPQKKTRKTKQYISEVITWGINKEKWKSAREFCKQRGWEFRLITEDQLGLRNK